MATTTAALGRITTFDEFEASRTGGSNLVPLTVQLTADLDTPLSLFLKVKKPDEVGFLLESDIFQCLRNMDDLRASL